DLTMVLKVHRSNYKIVGFTQDVSTETLARAPELADAALVVDLGSGLLDVACPWLDGPPPSWLAEEPAVRQTLAAGADLVLFSGDKLFGGPQAGIIAGRRDLVEKCGRHPLARAVRPGSLVLNAVQDTTLAYLDRRGDDIPLWRMVATPVTELVSRADAVVAEVGSDHGLISASCDSVPGGGTLPTVSFPSHGLRIDGDLVTPLRDLDRPVIARIENDETILDLRTVDPADDGYLAAGLRQVLEAR
ncbi:MAG: L-seryl-tRNA(Sec) selenium transferase, partial [Acidimicrobiia bacterium]|nr:L-seryl-tRNA(Sec) selenium transferase [Acidimicrobiia bacterium]